MQPSSVCITPRPESNEALRTKRGWVSRSPPCRKRIISLTLLPRPTKIPWFLTSVRSNYQIAPRCKAARGKLCSGEATNGAPPSLCGRWWGADTEPVRTTVPAACGCSRAQATKHNGGARRSKKEKT